MCSVFSIMRKWSPLLLFTILLPSCLDDSEELENVSPATNVKVDYAGDFTSNLEYVTPQGAKFEISSNIMDKNRLYIDVAYTGGCELHKFEFIWNHTIQYSEPPSLTLMLVHTNNDDLCEALFKERISLDMHRVLDSATINDGVVVHVMNGYTGEVTAGKTTD